MSRPDAMIRAHSWLDANPDAEALLVKWLREAIADHKTPRVKKGIERLRDECHLDRDGSPYAVDNSYSGPLARILVGRYPDLAGKVPMRLSKFDPPSSRPHDDLPPEIAAAWVVGRLL